MKYNYGQTMTSIKDVESCYERLEDEELKRIAKIAIENLSHVVVGLALPQALLMESIRRNKRLNYIISASKSLKISLDTVLESEKAKLFEVVEMRLKKESQNITDDAIKLLDSFREVPLIENAIRVQALNSLVNIWTIFESSTKEIWKCLLNGHQNIFLNNILKEGDNNEVEGISGKSISIDFLGKYNFNINNKLGEILCEKYDFTSCHGIKKAFTDLQKKKKAKLIFIDNPILYNLEITRNLIVHNAGIIDNKYLQKNSTTNQTMGELLEITIEKFNTYEEIMTKTLVGIFEYCEELLGSNAKDD